MADLKVPAFRNESEEAQWWFDHRDELATLMVEASRDGRNGEGSLGRRARKLAELAQSATEPQEALTGHK